MIEWSKRLACKHHICGSHVSAQHAGIMKQLANLKFWDFSGSTTGSCRGVCEISFLLSFQRRRNVVRKKCTVQPAYYVSFPGGRFDGITACTCCFSREFPGLSLVKKLRGAHIFQGHGRKRFAVRKELMVCFLYCWYMMWYVSGKCRLLFFLLLPVTDNAEIAEELVKRDLSSAVFSKKATSLLSAPICRKGMRSTCWF